MENLLALDQASKKHKVYLLIFPNEKKYCGYTSQKLARRWNNGNGYKHCPLVYRAILKYKWENVQKFLLASFDTAEEALAKEKEIISKYNLNNPLFGYNLDSGGKPHGIGDYITDETRQKLSRKSKERWDNPKYKEQMKEKFKVMPHPSLETIKKAIKASADVRRGKPAHNIKAVNQLDLNTGEIIKKYNSLTEASIMLTGKPDNCTNIRKVCLGQRSSALGFGWRFENE